MTTPAAPPRSVPLDEVMLAMDVVDTLRHNQALVEAELDEDSRARELTRRVQEIYASQGIEVPESVVAEGVQALAQDRFKYAPPERTFSVRLAEMYVERGKWAKRALIVGLLIGAFWLAFAIPSAMSRRAQVAAFRARLAEVAAQLGDANATAERLAGDLERARAAGAGASALALLDDAGAGLERARGQLASIVDEQRQGPAADAYPGRAEELDRTVAARRKALAQVAADLGAVRGHLQAVERLRGASANAERALARIADLELTAADRAELERLRSALAGAIGAGDAAAAKSELERLEALVALLDQSYELRIVSKPGDQSGVWRHPEGRRNARNYYIVVEAIGADGRPLTLPITSEEDRTTRSVRRFAVRVPESVYERVKADKQDNGIVDDNVFGHKRRGARAPEYRFETAGGMITEW
jgi:hypothetical protein